MAGRRRAAGFPEPAAVRRGYLRSLIYTLARFHDEGGVFMAAAISFYALLSLIPLLFTLINLFGYLLGRSPDMLGAVTGYVRGFYPMLGETLTREITRVAEHSSVGWISLAAFFWLASLVFGSLEYSMDRLFKAERRRHPFMSTLLSMSMVMVMFLMMAASFGVANLSALIARQPGLVSRFPGLVVLTGGVLATALPLLLVFLSFTALYKILPNRHVPVSLAARGGLAATLLWEAAKHGFAWYVGGVAQIGSVYGSLAAIVVFLLWIFYSSAIILLVGEMVYLRMRGEIA